MFSSASDRLFAAVLARKVVHGKKATQGCLSSVAMSMNFAGMVSVAPRRWGTIKFRSPSDLCLTLI